MIKIHCFLFFSFFLFGIYTSNAQHYLHLSKKANYYFQNNNYELAQRFYLEALQIAETEEKAIDAVNFSMALAKCYYYLNDHKSCFKWSYHALKIAKKHNLKSALLEPNYFLGALYIEDFNVDSVEFYSSKAIELAIEEKNFSKVSQTYSTLAELHINTSKNPREIERMIDSAIRYATISKSDAMLAFAYSKRYNYAFFLKKDYAEALKFVNKSQLLFEKTNNSEAILNAYRAKAECLIMLKDTTALSFITRWFQFKDSVLQAEKAIQVARFETLYETNKKEQENKILKKTNELNRTILIVVITVSLLIVVLGLWIFNRNRLKQKEQELAMLQNLQKDKERIARDLHDNVGGQLSFIIYSLDGITEDDIQKRIELKESLNEATKSVVGSLRETIWAISDANISIIDFSDKLKVFTRTIFKHSPTKIRFIEEITYQRELNTLLGLNLFRICQEILNNALKYANASEIKIQLVCKIEHFEISIIDNGIGFNVAEQNTGYGLQNIRKRADEFGFSLRLESEINQGTKYFIVV